MEDGNETKWEKKWLPDGQHYVFVHRITGEQTEPIVAECTCRCKAQEIETKFTPFNHETLGIKEEICPVDEKEEYGKDNLRSDTKFAHPCDAEVNGKNECSMDEEEEYVKHTTSSDETKHLWKTN